MPRPLRPLASHPPRRLHGIPARASASLELCVAGPVHAYPIYGYPIYGTAHAQVQLERELISAEQAASELAAAKERLESTVASLSEQQRLAAAERAREQERVLELEARAAKAEAEAEDKAAELSAELARSEASVAALRDQLSEIQGTLTSNVAAAAPSPLQGNATAAAAPAPDSASSSFAAEAAEVTREIEESLRGTGLLPVESAAGADADLAPRRPALSRMKKAELVGECEERGLSAKGAVAELRAMLRVERKRDGLVDELTERGWSERQSRRALDKVGWNVDKAIADLTKR